MKIEYRILSLLVILLIVFSTVGFQIHFHTCGITGTRTFQVIETPHCACEETKVAEDNSKSCCQTNGEHLSVNHKIEANSNISDLIKLKSMDCCQDEIISIIISDNYFTTSHKNYNLINICYNIIDLDIFKISRIENFKAKINSANSILKLPRDIIIEIFRISHLFIRQDFSEDSH